MRTESTTAAMCRECGRGSDLREIDLGPQGMEIFCGDHVPLDPECSCGGTGGDHDVDCVRWPF